MAKSKTIKLEDSAESMKINKSNVEKKQSGIELKNIDSVKSGGGRNGQGGGGKHGKSGGGKHGKSGGSVYNGAPYNFVPLNDIFVKAEEPADECFKKFKENTGYIELNIKTKTPIYIRGMLTEEMQNQIDGYDKQINNKKIDRQQRNHLIDLKLNTIQQFFRSPDNKFRIPGSSLRGMIKNITEIISYGKFRYPKNEDKRLYYRGLADRTNLKKEYTKKMTSAKAGNSPYGFSAGILKKVSATIYELTPCRKYSEGRQIYRIKIDACSSLGELNHYEYREIYFNNPKDDLIINNISATKDENHPNKGYLVTGGPMKNKNKYWIINEEDTSNTAIPIDESEEGNAIKEYLNDENRKSRDLIESKLRKIGSSTPVFYSMDRESRIIGFDHTGFFRIGYDKTILEHIPDNIREREDECKDTDFVDAIFGNKEKYAGRVYFEDAVCIGVCKEEEPDYCKILGEPKPTTFNHYLEQNPDVSDQNTYNSDAKIRGYKLYWHRDPEWKNSNPGENLKILTKMTPVRGEFKGRVKFENLSNVELGALLYSLELPEDCCHKIGMGKPYGLGSIRITPELFITDRNARYSNIKAGWTTEGAKKMETNIFKKAFKEFIIDKIGENDRQLEDLPRIKELFKMLNFKEKPPNKNTRYKKLSEFSNRGKLPKATNVT